MVFFFQPDIDGIAGSYLDRRLLDNRLTSSYAGISGKLCSPTCGGQASHTLSMTLLRALISWGDIRHDPRAGERMELELFSRIGAQMDFVPRRSGLR